MKSPEIIKQVLQIPITNYLANIVITPVNQAGQQLFYCSPKTNEKPPSLAVNPVKNVFYVGVDKAKEIFFRWFNISTVARFWRPFKYSKTIR